MPENTQHTELRSEQVQDILEAVPNWMIRWGNTLILLLIVMLIGISWFVKYPDIIIAEAMITTQIPPQKEYAIITGKIDTILVDDNQKVISDTPLAIIENTANYKDVFYLKSVIDTIKINNSNFSFPIHQMPILFLGDIESDYALFENSYLQYELNKQLQPYNSKALANKISLSELNSRLMTLKTQKRLSEAELKY